MVISRIISLNPSGLSSLIHVHSAILLPDAASYN